MTRYMPITGIDCIPATLLIDTEAPLDVLFETADYRIRTVTQVLENIAFRSDISSDTVVLTDFCKLLTTSLRDGCDVMDVIGRRLRAQVAEYESGRPISRPFHKAWEKIQEGRTCVPIDCRVWVKKRRSQRTRKPILRQANVQLHAQAAHEDQCLAHE